MTTAGNNYRRRILRLSRALAAICLVLMIALPIAVALYWALAETTDLAVHANLPAQAVQVPLLTWQRMAGAVITEVPLALLLVGLWHARKCFKLFAVGEVFTVAAVRCLQRFAGWVMASVGAGFIATIALSVLLTLHNPPGMRHLSIGISSNLIFTLFFAGMVWLMAAVIGQGQALAEENATFI